MKQLLLTIGLVVVSISAANAQLPANPVRFYVEGGMSIPHGDLNDDYNEGYHAALSIGLKLLPGLELLGRGAYHSFDAQFPDQFQADGGRFTALLYGVEGKFHLGQGFFNPYFIGGLGLAKVDWTDIDFKLDDNEFVRAFDSETKAYITVAVGLELHSLFVQARAVKILDKIELAKLSADANEAGSITFTPLSVGIRF
jgi:opacity protein-like surface antigen